MNELESNSCIDGIGEFDYMLDGHEDELVLVRQINTEYKFYNQYANKRTRNACVLYANARALGDLTGYTFSEKDLLEIVNLAEKSYGRHQDKGMLMNRGTDCLRNRWNNKFPDKQVVSYRCRIGDATYKKALELGYTIGVSYLTSSEYFIDSQDNGKIDSETSKDFNLKGGHRVRLIKANVIADNYANHKKYNAYINTRVEQFKDEGMFRLWGYLFAYKKDMTPIFKDVPVGHPFYDFIKHIKDEGITNGYNDGTFKPDATISRGEMAVMLSRLLTATKNGKN